METVKSVHAWIREKIAAYPNVTLGLWAGSLLAVTIAMWG